MGFITPIATDSAGNPMATGSQKEMGKNEFLQLMITKLQNQDPLDPMDDEDYIAQLAQFSSLEQMQNIASAVSKSNDLTFLQMQSINNSMAAGFIGKDVKASYDNFYQEMGDETTIAFTLGEYATSMNLNIKDETGATVAVINREGVAEGNGSITWDGRDTLGNQVADGYYTVEASAVDASGNGFTPDLALIGMVESVVYRDGSAMLVVNGTEIALGDVTEIGNEGSLDGDEG